MPVKPQSTKRGRPSREAAGKMADRILEAALGTLLDGGIDELTIARVAQRGRVSKKTMYTRFADKDDLVASLISYTLERYIWDDGRSVEEGDVKERLFTAICNILKNTLLPEMVAIEKAIQKFPELEWRPMVRATRVQPVETVSKLLLEARSAGMISFDDPIIPAFALLDAIVLGSRVRFFHLTEEERRERPVDNEARRLFELIWRGLTLENCGR